VGSDPVKWMSDAPIGMIPELLLGGDATHLAFQVFSPTGAYEGEAVMPVFVPDWGGALFARRVFYVRSEDADGRPIVVRLRVSRGTR